MAFCHVGVQLPVDDGGITVLARRGFVGVLEEGPKWHGSAVYSLVVGTVRALVVVGEPEGVLLALKSSGKECLAVRASAVLLDFGSFGIAAPFGLLA